MEEFAASVGAHLRTLLNNSLVAHFSSSDRVRDAAVVGVLQISIITCISWLWSHVADVHLAWLDACERVAAWTALVRRHWSGGCDAAATAAPPAGAEAETPKERAAFERMFVASPRTAPSPPTTFAANFSLGHASMQICVALFLRYRGACVRPESYINLEPPKRSIISSLFTYVTTAITALSKRGGDVMKDAATRPSNDAWQNPDVAACEWGDALVKRGTAGIRLCWEPLALCDGFWIYINAMSRYSADLGCEDARPLIKFVNAMERRYHFMAQETQRVTGSLEDKALHICVVKPDGESDVKGDVSTVKKFDTLHFDDKAALMPLLEKFRDGRLYPRRTGVENKLGILLHGPPGTGKTGFVHALANFLGRSVYVVPRNSFTPPALELALYSPTYVALIDEFDCVPGVLDRGGGGAAGARAPHAAATADSSGSGSSSGGGAAASAVDMAALAIMEPSDRKEALALMRGSKSHGVCDASFMLQTLDGIISRKDCCAVFCTNRDPDEILPEMRRRGRIDFVVRMGACSVPMYRNILRQSCTDTMEDEDAKEPTAAAASAGGGGGGAAAAAAAASAPAPPAPSAPPAPPALAGKAILDDDAALLPLLPPPFALTPMDVISAAMRGGTLQQTLAIMREEAAAPRRTTTLLEGKSLWGAAVDAAETNAAAAASGSSSKVGDASDGGGASHGTAT